MSVIQVSLLLDKVIKWVTYFSKSRKPNFIDDSSERNLRVWQFRDMLVRRRVTHSSADEH